MQKLKCRASDFAVAGEFKHQGHSMRLSTLRQWDFPLWKIESAPRKSSTPWKTCFHAMEKRQNWLPWRGTFPETCFHGMEKCRKWLPWRGRFSERRLPLRGAEVNGDKSGFHGVELLQNLTSMPWKNGTIRVPWRGKPANSTSMAWNPSRPSREPFFPPAARQDAAPPRKPGARVAGGRRMGCGGGKTATFP